MAVLTTSNQKQVKPIQSNQQLDASSALARPFVKWAGGKRSVHKELLGRLPKYWSKADGYHEPFLGGGALFFALAPQQADLAILTPI